jgi:hypothetical protein
MTPKKHLQDEQQFVADIRDLFHAGREKAYHIEKGAIFRLTAE